MLRSRRPAPDPVPLGAVRLLVLAWAALLLTPAGDARAQTDAGHPDATGTLPQPALREAPTLRFERLSIEEGLVQRSAQALMQDAEGFMWIGTQAGVHRYDGHQLRLFAPEPFDTTSLSSGIVWDLAPSANGDVWVATAGGLNRLDPATGRAVQYRHDPDDRASLPSDQLNSVLEASTGDVWAATVGSGLSRMRPEAAGRFHHLRHDPDDAATLTSDYLTEVTEGPDGAVWAGSYNGLNRVDPATGAVTRFLHEPAAEPTTPGRYSTGTPHFPAGSPETVWVPTYDGLVRLDTQTGEAERFRVVPNRGDAVDPRNSLRHLVADPNDPPVLWLTGTSAGLVRFDTRTETFTTYRHDPNDPNSLGDDQGTALLADRTGKLWVGTSGAGANAFNPESANFAHLRHDPQDPQSLAPGLAFELYEDRSGSLWVTTEVRRGEEYVTRFDGRTGRTTRYRHDPDDPNTIQAGSASAFAEDAAGRLWIGHFFPGGGLSRMDPATGAVRRFRPADLPGNDRRRYVTTLAPTRADPDVLWVGSAGGLDRLDTRTGTFDPVPLDLRPDGNPPWVRDLHEDPQGTLWLSVGSVGLVRVRDGEAAVARSHDPRDTTSISSDHILKIAARAAEPGVLWLATDAGLNRYDTRTGAATHYLTEDGLPDNTIYGLLEDDAGTLWMSTNNGISNFDPETGTFRNYGLDDGLMALEYNHPGSARGAGGVLYFSSAEGVTAFSPEALTTNAVPPPVALTDFRLFNRSVTPGPDGPLTQPLGQAERITLAHDQNEVAFEFAALHFANPAKNRYAYRLEGYDADWVEVDAEHRTASYTNLPPGDYTFRVRAANPDGVWNEAGAALGLTILPPWWRTPWAYALFAALLAAGVFAVDRVQRRRLAAKERERAQIREAELRAEAQARRREDAERLAEIGRAITSTLSIREVIDTVYEHVNALMDAAVFGIGIHDAQRHRILFPAMKERGETLPPFSNSLDDDSRPAVWCFTRREPFVVGDFASEHERYLSARSAPVAGDDAASIIYLPLVHQDRTVGVITTQSFEKDAYTDYHVSVLRTLATYAAIALDNAESYRQLDATVSELRATQQQLVQQEKLASLGALTAGIAHEIKNPLNFVNNFSSLSGELVEELEEALREEDHEEVAALLADLRLNVEKIEEHGQRADGIVRSMMAHARGGEGRRETVAFNAFVDEYVDLAYHGQRARVPGFSVDVVRDYGENVGTIEVMPQEIGRVVLNLVSNAFDALEEHAAGQNGTYAPRLRVATRREGDRVAVRIEDNGPGIPEDVRARIFEPFFTTKPTGKGTGLGLSMSHDIVTQGHGGTLDVETAEGRGTTFVITLPVALPARPLAPVS